MKFSSWAALLLHLSAGHRQRILQGLVLSIMARLCDLLPMAIVGRVVNTLTVGQAQSMARTMAEYGILVALCFFGLALFQSGSDYFLSAAAQSVRHDIRIRLFSHILSMDAADLESRRKGDLLSIITNDVDALNGFFSETIANGVRVLIAFAGTYGYLFWLDARLALILVFPLPLAFWVMGIFSKKVAPRYMQSRNAVGNFTGTLENSLQGIDVLQAYCAEHTEIRRLEKQSAAYRDTALDAARIRRNFIPVIYGIAGLSFGLLVGGGGWLTQMPGGPSMGDYTCFVLMGMRLVVPIFTLNFLINQIQQAKAAALRVKDLLALRTRLGDRPDAADLETAPQTIRFEGIRFGYPGGQELFTDLNFTIRKGDFIGIAGPTGAGKSSLVKLLLRFYGPSSGRISFNGKDLDALTAKSVRRHVGYVSQQPFLFHGSVLENICLGHPGADKNLVTAAMEKAGVMEIIQGLPRGLDTLVGDQGNRLSGGQKQRISLARALLHNPDILILDEATSAVDPVTEALIHDSILALRRNRIIIAVAHRLSTLTACDRIFVMDRGCKVQEGSHRKLVCMDGVYRNLWQAFEREPS